MSISKYLGYRKLERHSPTFGQWLQERGEDDAGLDLYYLSNIGPSAMARRVRNGRSYRWARGMSKELLATAVQQIRNFHDAVDRGEVEVVSEYVPLDPDDEADQAYLRVQIKRAGRGMELHTETPPEAA